MDLLSTRLRRTVLAFGLMTAAVATLAFPGSTVLSPGKPILIAGGSGGFDWMLVDEGAKRVFATHKGTKTVAIVDLKTDHPLPSVKVGTAQGVAVDPVGGRIFLGDEDERKVVVLNYQTLKTIGEVAVSGPVDDILFCPKNGMVYADKDDGEDVWVINPKRLKVISTIKVPNAPEKIEYDRVTGLIYQNIKSNNTVQVIDPKTNKVIRVFETAPATGPHGMVIDSKTGRLFSAGSNGKLVVIDLKSGKVISTVDIEKGVDQIAFDPGNKRIYCACRGSISVAVETTGGAKLIGNVTSPRGAHTITVDPHTHAVWICYPDGHDSYLQKYVP